MNKLVSDGSVKKINYAGVNTYRWQGENSDRPPSSVNRTVMSAMPGWQEILRPA